ncbi:MAG TPA: hypothetical protein VFS88_04600 [Micavibrio sp.]|nr:hypothetical protein [Micavibrio sp.]
MSALNDFLDEERALIVSVPVRVGYWISHVDDLKATARDDTKEQLAIERAMKLIISRTADTRFINDVAEYALAGKAEWAGWRDRADTVLDDLPRALRLIKDRLPVKDLKDYQSAIYRVAGVVAQAASENGGEDDLSREVMGAGLVARLLDRLSVKTDMSVPENISDAEKAALQKLLACLKG